LSPTFRALTNHNYRLYAAGGVVSNTGTWMQRVAQDWLVITLSRGTGDSAIALGITTGLQFLPILLFSAYAGLVADRFPKRRMLQLTQAAMAVPALLLGALALTGTAQTWHVFVLAFVFGIGTAFDAPTRQSFVSEMVGPDDLTNAVGLNSASFNVARIVGPAVAGGLIALFGSGVQATGAVIVLNALSYGAVIYALQRMRVEDLDSPEPVSRGPGMIRDGMRYVRGRPDVMLVLAIVFFAGTFGMNFQMTSALMATQVFHKGAGEYGLLGTTMAIGSLAGALLAAGRIGRPRQRLLVLAGLSFGVVEIASGLMPSYLWFALLTPLLGITVLTMITAANSSVQLSVAPSMRGRVMALYMMIFQGGTPLGAPVVGWVGDTFGARWTLIGGGAMTIIGIGVAVVVFSVSTGVRMRPWRDRSSERPASLVPPYSGAREPALPPLGDSGSAGWSAPDRPGRVPDEALEARHP
jgi:MFS family permease